ncbi:MAG: phosphoribosyltransferase family protein [Aquificaceae bacterium]
MVGFLQLAGIALDECRSCGKRFVGIGQGYICSSCIQEIKPHTPIDRDHKFEFISQYSIFGLYEGPLKTALLSLKFEGARYLAKVIAERIKDHFWEFASSVEPDFVSFAPINLRRLWVRGFNQVEEILKHLGVQPVKLFSRKDLKGPLARYDASQRQMIVSGFKLRENVIDLVDGKRILLVDDILTTGATINKLSELLMSAGTSEVFAYFIAKA